MAATKECKWHKGVHYPRLGKCPRCLFDGNPWTNSASAIKTAILWILIAAVVGTVAYYGYQAVVAVATFVHGVEDWKFALVGAIIVLLCLIVLGTFAKK